MDLVVRLGSLLSSGGDEIELPLAGVTCFVGDNNVGKSQVLRDVVARLGSLTNPTITITDLTLHGQEPVSPDEATAFLEKHAVRGPTDPGVEPSYWPIHGGSQLNAQQFLANYQMQTGTLQAATSFFAWHASAGSLLNFASSSIGTEGFGVPSHPLGRLYSNGDLEAELSTLSLDAFGLPLTLDRITGDVRLRVGTVGVEVPPIDHPTPEYADAVQQLPMLEHQGDGIKSFIGIALAVIAGSSQVLLIDEPEAFLHPAQARSLGRWLGIEAVKRDIQVLLATHDRDLLLGLLAAGSDAVNVVRLTRDGTQNFFQHISGSDVGDLWGNPVLRYSNILQGLFHRVVAICEGDADCRFYGAVLDQLAADTQKRARADGVLFVPSGGAPRIAHMAAGLSRLGVETHALLDFDTLSDRNMVRAIVKAVGQEWTDDMNDAYVTFADAVNEQGLWGELKIQGLSAVPAGSPYSACERLLGDLDVRRVHLVRVGELECFDKSSALHGPAWVSEMLERGVHTTSQPAKDLVQHLL